MGDIVRYTRQGKFIGWYVRYRDVDGRRKQRASHQPSKELARRYLLEIEGRIARGQVGIPEPAPAPEVVLVADLVERFLTEYSRPKIKDLASYRLHVRKYFRMVLPFIGKTAADTLKPTDVAKMRDNLGSSYAPGTTRVCLAYLGAAYAWAVKLGIVTNNPVKGVERPTAESSIEYYSRDEVMDLLRCAAERASMSRDDQLIACLVHFALFTGLRRGELLGLRWQDLDFDTQRLTVAKSYAGLPKGGKARYLRLPSVCIPVLRDWRRACPRNTEGHVFPMHFKILEEKLPMLLKAAGVRVPAHPCHALRHSFASHFIMAGGNILTLQKILGHSDVKMTLIYAHLAPDFLGTEMERLKF
jgi:integrase